MAPLITAAQVEANRRSNLQVSADEQQKLFGIMELPPALLLTREEFRDFEAYRANYYEQILNSEFLKYSKILHEGLEKLMDYASDVVGKTGVFMFLCFFKHFCPNPSEEEMEEAYFMAWSFWMMYGIYMPYDDLTDRTLMRRFKPAYHVQVGTELAASEMILMFQACEAGLAAKFNKKTYYNELNLAWTRSFTLATAAQTMDVKAQQVKTKRWDFAFRDECNQVLFHCLHELPLEIAALMTGYELDANDVKIWRGFNTAVQNMMRNINDINDTYPSTPTGKPLYTDIANGSPSWCSTKAFELAHEEQRKTLKDNYGDEDPEKIAAVLQVYEDVGLKKHAKAFHQKSVQEVVQLLKKCPESIVPQDALMALFNYAADEHGLCWH